MADRRFFAGRRGGRLASGGDQVLYPSTDAIIAATDPLFWFDAAHLGVSTILDRSTGGNDATIDSLTDIDANIHTVNGNAALTRVAAGAGAVTTPGLALENAHVMQVFLSDDGASDPQTFAWQSGGEGYRATTKKTAAAQFEVISSGAASGRTHADLSDNGLRVICHSYGGAHASHVIRVNGSDVGAADDGTDDAAPSGTVAVEPLGTELSGAAMVWLMTAAWSYADLKSADLRRIARSLMRIYTIGRTQDLSGDTVSSGTTAIYTTRARVNAGARFAVEAGARVVVYP